MLRFASRPFSPSRRRISIFLLVTLVAIMGGAWKCFSQSSAQGLIVLENERVRFGFTSTGGILRLIELLDKRTGFNFAENAGGPQNIANLWDIKMRATNGTIVSLNPARSGQNPTVRQNRVAAGEELNFVWQNVPVQDTAVADVTMSVFLPTNSPFAEWRISVDNRSRDYGTWIVRYPHISNIRKLSPNGEQEFLAIPGGNGGGAGEGQLYKNPFQTLKPRTRTYPCYYQSMQFNAYYGPMGGLYLATYDGDANLKGFLIEPKATPVPALSYMVENYPADSGVPGVSFRQEHAAIVGPFQGDWYDAARIYRQWALRQKWCRLGPLHQRTDIAPSIRNGAYWMLGTFEWPRGKNTLLRSLARTLPEEEVRARSVAVDVPASLALVREAYNYFQFPMILWTNEWYEGGGDLSPPRYIPRRDLEPYFEALHREFPDVTMSGYIAPLRYSVQAREYGDEVLRNVQRDADGKPRITPPIVKEHGDQHAFPCWATPFWKNFWANKSYSRAQSGIDGWHVDELASSTSFKVQCFDRSHGHPIGGGTVYADSRRDMLRILRDNARRVNPKFTVHHEALSEIYIDVSDLAEVATSPSNINIPMYEAVYHDYNFTMGRRIIKWNNRRTFPKGAEDGDVGIEEFVASFGQTFVWGNQPGWTRIDIVSYAPRIASIIKRFGWARRRALKFLDYGDMMKPLEVTSNLPLVRTIWQANDTPEHIMPAVINSVWKAPDGTIGIVLVNISATPQTVRYRYDLTTTGLRAASYRLRRIDEDQNSAASMPFGNPRLERTDTIEPYSLKILEISAS